MDLSTKKLIYIMLGVVAVVIIVWYIYTKVLPKNSSQQAVYVPVTPVPSTPTPLPLTPSLPSFAVGLASYLAKYAGDPVAITTQPPPLQIGDSYWVGVQTPDAKLVLVPFSVTSAEARLQNGLLIPGNQYVVQIIPGSYSAEVNISDEAKASMGMQSSTYTYTYASYGTQSITLTAGVLRDIMRGNKSLFMQLFNAVSTYNTPLIQSLLAQNANNPQLQAIINVLSQPGNLVAPLAISYNAAMALGILPPQIQSYVVYPSQTIIDFGYT